MLSITIPETVQHDLFFDEMKTHILNGVESFEFQVSQSIDNQLKINTNYLQPIYLNDVLGYIVRQQLSVQLVLDFTKPYLEVFAIPLVEKWGLEEKVRYAGNMAPSYLSLWNRRHVYYDVTNCLPNYYHLGEIKRAHFDVIHYFLRKNKVSILRVHESGVTDDIINWVAENELTLSVYGVESHEMVDNLLRKGIDHISTSAIYPQGASFQKMN